MIDQADACLPPAGIDRPVSADDRGSGAPGSRSRRLPFLDPRIDQSDHDVGEEVTRMNMVATTRTPPCTTV